MPSLLLSLQFIRSVSCFSFKHGLEITLFSFCSSFLEEKKLFQLRGENIVFILLGNTYWTEYLPSQHIHRSWRPFHFVLSTYLQNILIASFLLACQYAIVLLLFWIKELHAASFISVRSSRMCCGHRSTTG